MSSQTPAIRLFSSDLDGTLLGNPEATRRFKIAWKSIPDAQRPVLVYNSGRLVPDIKRLLSQGLLATPDYLIAGVGTQIFDVHAGQMLKDFDAQFQSGWDSKRVVEILSNWPGVKPQPPEFQYTFKSSWFLEKAHRSDLEKIEKALTDAGLEVSVVYSSFRDLDILPKNATKGLALQWLCERLKISLDQVLVAGDTANDAGMFRLPGVRGIIVENAQPELFEAVVDIQVYVSRQILADGVLDVLPYFCVVGGKPPPP